MSNPLDQALAHIDAPPTRQTGLSRLIRARHEPVDLSSTQKGGAIFVVAGGPALAEMDLDGLNDPGIVTMALNNASSVFRPNQQVSLDQPAKFLTSVWNDPNILKFAKAEWANGILWDQAKWDFGTKRAHECPNVIWFTPNEYKAGIDDTWDERWFDEPRVTYGHFGVWRDENKVKQHGGGGRSVFMAALKLAYMQGFRRVYLVGCTFFMTASKAYGFEQKVWDSKVLRNNELYVLTVSRLTRLGPAMKAKGFEIVNVTPGSHLRLFPCMPLAEAIERERIDTLEATGVADEHREDWQTESLYGRDLEAHDLTPEQVRKIKELHAASTPEERAKGRYWRTIGEQATGKSKGNGPCAVAEGRVWREIT